MSNLIHCDGPNCDQVRDPNAPVMRRLGESGWIHVEEGPDDTKDFHSRACLAAWSSQLDTPGIPRPEDRPCTCHAAQYDPHTKAEHQAYPTEQVNGL